MSQSLKAKLSGTRASMWLSELYYKVVLLSSIYIEVYVFITTLAHLLMQLVLQCEGAKTLSIRSSVASSPSMLYIPVPSISGCMILRQGTAV